MARPAKNLHIPMRGGVSPSSLALPSLRQPPWTTVLGALTDLLPRIPQAEWHARMANGQVMNDLGQPLSPDAPYQKCLRVYYWRDMPQEQAIPFAHTVLFRDDHLLVADKPHFLPVTPGGRYVQETLLARLKHELNLPELSPLHRLDRETAGVVAFCLRPQDRDAYQRLFRDRQVHKVYEAMAAMATQPTLPDAPQPLVHATAQAMAHLLTRRSHIRENPAQFFRMEEAPDAEGLPPNSETHIALLSTREGYGHFRLTPVTGKRHQLRVHMAALGWPLMGDQFYPDVLRQPGDLEDFAQPLQLLARQLAFEDPVTGQQRCFDSQLSLNWPQAI
jgi:tRNA pseudouridine32 synthase/23S rRNA pseudouridine746 synthase